MKTELSAASLWWSSHLHSSQKLSFQMALEQELAAKLEGHWHADTPQLGSAFRSVSTDMRLDPVLAAAASTAMITQESFVTQLPHSTTMWINPGEVKVNQGGCFQVIYEGPASPCDDDNSCLGELGLKEDESCFDAMLGDDDSNCESFEVEAAEDQVVEDPAAVHAPLLKHRRSDSCVYYGASEASMPSTLPPRTSSLSTVSYLPATAQPFVPHVSQPMSAAALSPYSTPFVPQYSTAPMTDVQPLWSDQLQFMPDQQMLSSAYSAVYVC